MSTKKPNTADAVIQKFGGQSALARLLDRSASTVNYWSIAGSIPSKWHSQLLQLASQKGVDLSPSDLVAAPPPVPKKPVGLPKAVHMGTLSIGDWDKADLTCFVLDDGRRVISRSAIVRSLTAGRSKDFENVKIDALAPYLPPEFDEQMIEFDIEGVTHPAKGIQAENFADLCTAFVAAFQNGAVLTDGQREMAKRASAFLAACAKVGLLALIDEATGYQYERARDALQVKLKAFLADEMRKWEKTFPDQLWNEFGRLTKWKGTAAQRPKYWGKLVIELVYEYLDSDVAAWLKQNVPEPRKGQNYHQWLTGQFGLKKLLEHIWMLIGIASTCHSMPELRRKMAERFGRIPVQFTLFVEPPDEAPRPTPLPPSINIDDL